MKTDDDDDECVDEAQLDSYNKPKRKGKMRIRRKEDLTLNWAHSKQQQQTGDRQQNHQKLKILNKIKGESDDTPQ